MAYVVTKMANGNPVKEEFLYHEYDTDEVLYCGSKMSEFYKSGR